MRIRRRPQASLHQASDPATASASPSQTLQNASRNRDDEEEEGVDLGGQKSAVARRLALPQENAVDSGLSASEGQGAGGDVHMRCRSSAENGHHSWDQSKDSVTCTGAVGSKPKLLPAKVEEHASSNGVMLPVAPASVAVKGESEKKVSNGIGGGSGANNKKRRGPAVLLEGSRCSRVNGRGWRCSQPTLVGYSLCEHHLGKGRARSSGGGAGNGSRGGPGQLGRTEHRPRALLPAPTAVSTVTIAAAPPSAEGIPGLPSC